MQEKQQQHVTRRTSHVTRRTHTSHVTRHNIDLKFNAKGAAPEMMGCDQATLRWIRAIEASRCAALRVFHPKQEAARSRNGSISVVPRRSPVAAEGSVDGAHNDRRGPLIVAALVSLSIFSSSNRGSNALVACDLHRSTSKKEKRQKGRGGEGCWASSPVVATGRAHGARDGG